MDVSNFLSSFYRLWWMATIRLFNAGKMCCTVFTLHLHPIQAHTDFLIHPSPKILTLRSTQGLVLRGAPSIRDLGISVPLCSLFEREVDFDLLRHLLRHRVFA